MEVKNIDALTSGQDLDLLVAEEVLGWKKTFLGYGIGNGEGWMDPSGFGHYLLPQYSTQVSEAILIAFELHQRGWEMEIFVGHVSPGAFCNFRKTVDTSCRCYVREAPSRETALATAICKAALFAVRYDVSIAAEQRSS